MLKPAILYKEEIEKKFSEHIYDDDMFFYNGYPYCHHIPDIKLEDENFQYAIVNKNDDVIGYFCYKIWTAEDTVMNIGLYSFEKNNPIITLNVYNKMKELAKNYRRIEWRVISDNPVDRLYSRFMIRFNGHRSVLHKVIKDRKGKYHDDIVYEIVNS